MILAAGFLGVFLGNYPMDRATNPELEFLPWLREITGGVIMRFVGWGNYILAAALMPNHTGWAMAVVVALFLAVFCALQLGGALRLMRLLGIIRPPAPRLQALVDVTSSAMNVRVKATWEIAGTTANALAFVTTRELAFGRKVVEACPDDELRAICAHELGHLTENRWTLAGRVIGALTLSPLIFVRPAWAFGAEAGVAGLGLVIVGIWYGNLRLSRVMEKRADQVARENVEDAASYARGLERIHRLNRLPAVLKQSSHVHPSLYDRMLAAGVTPDFPRPEPASAFGWSGMLVTVIWTLLAMRLLLP